MIYENRISSSPVVMLGKPAITGTRISVELVLRKIAEGASFQQIQETYPNLKVEDIRACIDYAADIVAKEEILTCNSFRLNY